MEKTSRTFGLMALVIAFVLPLPLLAAHKYDFSAGNIFYNVTDKAGLTVEVTYGSDYGQYFGAIDIPSKVSSNGVYYTVTKVGSYAFAGCSGVTSVTFPETVTTIADRAFKGCNAMLSMTIPATILSIGNYAFESCSSFTTLVLEYSPDALSFGKGASRGADYSLFSDCPLESVTVRRPLNFKDGYSPFNNNTKLKNATIKNLTGVHRYLFNGCTALKNVSLSDAVITIGDYAFAGCKSLNEIEIPVNVTTISNSAFKNCNNLRSFNISSNVQTIGDYAFANCITLTDFTIPGNVTSIGNYAFSGCTAIKTLKFEPGAAKIEFGKGASKGADYGLFYDCPLETLEYRRGMSFSISPFKNHPTLQTVTISNLVNTGSNFFNGCSALTSVTMSNSMVTINEYAFANCNALRSINIPTSVKTIEKGAFSGCNYLSTFDMGSTEDGCGIEEIGDYCFSGCLSLPGLIFPPSLKKIGNYAFMNCTAFTNFAIEESENALALGDGCSKGEKYGLFRDCPLTTVFIGRDLTYNYSPLSYSTKLVEVKIGNPVTRLNSYLLKGDTELVKLHFNQSCVLSSIGKYTFADCTKLPTHIFPESLTGIEEGAFQNCIEFNSFTIGPNVSTIGAYAFSGCNQLTGIIIPPSVTSIGNYAFMGCTSINNITIEEGTEKLDLGCGATEGEKTALFKDCPIKSLFLGRTLTYGGYQPFGNISTLEEVRIGNPVTRIGNSLFCDCYELKTVVFNQSCKLESVGKYTFSGCSKLSLPSFPQTVTIFDDGAFQGCTSFTSFTIYSNVTKIGNFAFNNCTNINKLIIEDGSEILTLGYGNDTGDDNTAGKGLFEDCPLESVYLGRTLNYSALWKQGSSPFARLSSIKEFKMGNNVTSIDNQFFRGCSGLESMSIPANVTNIGKSAFIDCSGLKTLSLPSGLKTIGDYAFTRCTSLTEMTIPSSVNSIGNYAFSGCSGITAVNLSDGDEVLKVGYGASQGEAYGLFYDCPLEKFYYGRTLSYTEKSDYGYSPLAIHDKLNKITIGTKVSKIPYCAFYKCTAITELYIPASVKSIHSSFASNCTSLKNVFIINSTVPTTDSYNTLLANTAEGSKFYVFFPDDFKKADNWKKFSDLFEPICTFDANFTYTGKSHHIGWESEFPINLYEQGTEETNLVTTKTDAGSYVKTLDVSYSTNGYDLMCSISYPYIIKKAPLTATPQPCSRRVGEDMPPVYVNWSGFVNNETSEVITKLPSYSTTAKKNSPVGTYPITLSGAEAANYDISYVAGTLTIVANVFGDANVDGKTDAQDIVDITNYIAGKNKYMTKEHADINKDGVVNVADVIIISNTILSE